MQSDQWQDILDADDLVDGDIVKIGGYHREYAVRVGSTSKPDDNALRFKRDYDGGQDSNVFYHAAVHELCALGLVRRKIIIQPGQIWADQEGDGPCRYWLVTSGWRLIRLNQVAADIAPLRRGVAADLPITARLVLEMTPETT